MVDADHRERLHEPRRRRPGARRREEDTDGGFAHGGWSMPYFDPEAMGAAIGEVMEDRGAALRAAHVAGDGRGLARPGGDPFADRMNAIPKYVASRTLTEADLEWNTTLLPADDAIGAVRDLRERDGGGIQVMGSAPRSPRCSRTTSSTSTA